MAEAILFNVAARIIESLGSLALKEIGQLWGVTDELKKLKDTVSTIQAVLLDAEEQCAVNRQVRDWLERLKDVFYDADDLLDGFSTDSLLREMTTDQDKMAKKVRIFFSKSNPLVYDLKMGHRIKTIRQKLDAIANDRKFHLEERPVEIGVRARKRDDSHSYVLAAKVTGREDDKKEIIKRLLSDSDIKENVGILPITGIGGLGKTTLAQFIFNDEEIDKHFQLKMWACVSESFDVQKVVEKILESATKKKPEIAGLDTLVHNLRKEIGGKKYLLVLDDVWNEDVKKWDDLKELLEVGASGSRILITTRSKRVAQITQTIEEYSLQCLDERESWCLFKQVAFENGQEPVNSRKVEVGKEIVEKCSGVPLVIKTIGRLLSLENSEAGWVSFGKDKMPEIKEDGILPTLKLSYDQLPSHLKQCFAYCSIFPKDYVMEKSKLINLWIAQGFIQPSNRNECLEDGDKYFMHLLWRSFFQEAEMDDLGNVITSKMHDLMHDLAMSVAGPLITRLESKEKIIIDQKTRHVAVVDNIDISFVNPTSSSKASRIRTLLSLGESENLQESSTSCEAIFSTLKFLRVLDLHRRRLDLVPSSICKLKHLRDLDLSWNDKIEKLPDSISRLQNLYTLRLSGCRQLKELPRGITKLVNLRHLYNDGCENLTCMPRGLGELKNLQTLSEFVVHSDLAPNDSGLLSELNRLNSLRGELEISGLRSREEDVANLKEKEHLQVLILTLRDEMALEGFEPHPNLKKLKIDYYMGLRVPMWLLSLTNLVDLRIWFCRKLKYLPPLSGLPFLKTIFLWGLEEIEYVSDCSDNNELSLSSFSSSSEFFPSLETIWLNNCGNLKGWWRSDSYNVDVNTTTDHQNSFETPSSMTRRNALLFPRLSKLSIRRCPKLKSLSQGVQYLTALHDLRLIDCPVLDLGNDEHGMQWKGLNSLISLNFRSIPKLVSLPLGLQHVTTLQELRISDCSSLMTIPEWICNWASLEQFTISRCSGLTSLPEAMSRLTSLKVLTIHDCPILLQRCKQDGGEDWPKIAHIPKLDLS